MMKLCFVPRRDLTQKLPPVFAKNQSFFIVKRITDGFCVDGLQQLTVIKLPVLMLPFNIIGEYSHANLQPFKLQVLRLLCSKNKIYKFCFLTDTCNNWEKLRQEGIPNFHILRSFILTHLFFDNHS